ncbi:hypothetical protein OS493_035524 [Desmophyllum pertusum]|uniref:Uncharacterized protein n=1 Tax=Desmophyllum pertusum TaxID=174260 RepID=A0A9X0CJB6_9CNID|nr:hypothetical protein OS493_035524 [Desmophyllum pertusum]
MDDGDGNDEYIRLMEDEEEEEEGEGEEEEEEEEEDPVEEVYFDVTRFIDSENDTVDNTGAENDDNGVTAGRGRGVIIRWQQERTRRRRPRGDGQQN